MALAPGCHLLAAESCQQLHLRLLVASNYCCLRMHSIHSSLKDISFWCRTMSCGHDRTHAPQSRAR